MLDVLLIVVGALGVVLSIALKFAARPTGQAPDRDVAPRKPGVIVRISESSRFAGRSRDTERS